MPDVFLWWCYCYRYHPHGIISIGCFVNFCSDANKTSKLFPGQLVVYATQGLYVFVMYEYPTSGLLETATILIMCSTVLCCAVLCCDVPGSTQMYVYAVLWSAVLNSNVYVLLCTNILCVSDVLFCMTLRPVHPPCYSDHQLHHPVLAGVNSSMW